MGKPRGARAERPNRKPRLVKGLTPLTSDMDDLLRDFSRRDDSELQAKTTAQAHYINAIRHSVITFGIGPAGTGKTFIAASLAAEALIDREVDRIILTRPAVEAGESLGFLPGELMEKYAPYLQPVQQVLERRLGKGAVEAFIKSGKIVALPLAYMRGWTFENAFVLLDEAQNTTPAQMKLFLTRIGEDCRVVIDGDPSQSDIPGRSGLSDVIDRLRCVPDISFTIFEREDIVRSGLVQNILERYS